MPLQVSVQLSFLLQGFTKCTETKKSTFIPVFGLNFIVYFLVVMSVILVCMWENRHKTLSHSWKITGSHSQGNMGWRRRFFTKRQIPGSVLPQVCSQEVLRSSVHAVHASWLSNASMNLAIPSWVITSLEVTGPGASSIPWISGSAQLKMLISAPLLILYLSLVLYLSLRLLIAQLTPPTSLLWSFWFLFSGKSMCFFPSYLHGL